MTMPIPAPLANYHIALHKYSKNLLVGTRSISTSHHISKFLQILTSPVQTVYKF